MKSIQRQTYPAEFLETIVVDNQSSDCTKELALGFTENKFYNNEIFYININSNKVRIKICNLPFLRKK